MTSVLTQWSSQDQCFQWIQGGKTKYIKFHKTWKGRHWRSWAVGQDVIQRFCLSTWWSWKGGSRPHFWRWLETYLLIIWNGHPLWMEKKLKPYRVLQRDQKDLKVKAQIIEKINKVQRLGYIEKGKVDSLTSFFAVSKTNTDIQVVYNATVSGLNKSTWAPWFALPTVRTHL